MSEREKGNPLLVIIIVAAAVLFGSFLFNAGRLDHAFDTANKGAADVVEGLTDLEEAIDEAIPESISESLEPLEEAIDEARVQALELQVAELQDQRDWYRRRSHRAEGAAVDASEAPQEVSDTSPSGWQPPCPDGCDVGGASSNVPQGVLVAWRDAGYDVTRDELRVNLNRAGVGRVERNTVDCIELVRLPQKHPTEREVSTQDAQGGGSIGASGVLADTGYTPNQELLRAQHSQWRYCQ